MVHAPKEAQELARHGTLELTMNVYGRVRQGRLAHIVEDVGEFLRPKEAEVVPPGCRRRTRKCNPLK